MTRPRWLRLPRLRLPALKLQLDAVLVCLLVIGGAAGLGAPLWSWWGWEAAVAWWCTCALVAGISEVVE